MDIKNLYTLIAIADRGSFAEAANALGVSLSAVSMQMRALEDSLGTMLFDRSRRPPVLTDSGLDFTQRARELIAHWESMNEALKRENTVGLLKLGAVHTCVSGLLPLALKQLQISGQPMDILLTTGLTHELEKTMFHRQLDAAILTQPDTVPDDNLFIPFVEETLVVITHKSTRLKTYKEILEGTPYVRFNRAASVGNLIHQEITKRKINLRSMMEIDTLEGVIAMVANGLGSSVVPSRGVKNEFPSSVVTSPFGNPPLKRRLGVLYPRNSPRMHLIQSLLASLASVSRQELSAGNRAGSTKRAKAQK
jgi:DNA-binding transcriptional LysR family regulator